MSGRSRYRKSDHPLLGRVAVRRAARTPPDAMPDWRASFVVPGALVLKVSPGMATGMVGVAVRPGPLVVVIGKQREWVLTQAARFFGSLAIGHPDLHVVVTMTRSCEPPATAEAPSRPGYNGSYDLIYVPERSVILQRPLDRPIVIAM